MASSRRPNPDRLDPNGLGISNMARNSSPVPPYDQPMSPSYHSHASYGSHHSANSHLLPHPPTSSAPPLRFSPAPLYAPLPASEVSSVPPSTAGSYFSPVAAQPRLPYFEAALARARGETPPIIPQSTTPQPLPRAPQPPPPRQYHTPAPAYLPPPDPNHPDLNVGMIPSTTVRYAMDRTRELSRSPSPGFDDSVAYERTTGDVEKALLGEQDHTQDPFSGRPTYSDHHGDMSLMTGAPIRDSMYKEPIDGFDTVPLNDAGSSGHGHEDEPHPHYGPAPTGRVGRRGAHRRVRQTVTLDDTGMFAVDMQIPTRLAQFLPVKGVEEMRTTRYTAVTTDPDGFADSGILLRQNKFTPPRQTELFIVVTMYNEDATLFCRTLYGVMKNIAHLCGRKNSRTWGPNGWQKVVICIVSDGRKNCNPRVLDCLAALGVYQEGVMTNKVKDRPVTAHVFEYTTSFALDPDLHFKYPDKGIVPCQIIFCLKEKNAKKINSHRWFFNAFGPLLQPNICILLDVGTMPGPKSLYHLWKSFDVNSNVGGACGEIATFKGKSWQYLLNPLVAAQCFEYKMSNILDKPMESLFGYCAVLPGAFSAYRYIALQNDSNGKGPLASYFMGENLHSGKADSFTANMYLAEDRVLCFEIVAKPNANWVLKYVKSAVGETDCPDTIPEFIGQRRRWLNGSFFAAVYALMNTRRIWSSGHSFSRRVSLMVEFVYNFLNLLFGWFSLANFYIFFVILTNSLSAPEYNIKGIGVLNTILQYIYLGTLVACFIFGMGNRPQGAPWKYKSAIYIFAVLTMYMLVCGVVCTIKAISQIGQPVFARMIVSLCATYGIFVVSSFLALDPWHIFTCFLQYLLFTPTYVNVLNIYAYSNLHDLSWGTKGDTTVASDLGEIKGFGNNVEAELVSAQQDIDSFYQDALDNIRIKRARVDSDEMASKPESGEQKQKDNYANFRTNLLLLWSLSNALLAGLILAGSDTSSTFTSGSGRTAIYMMVILIFVAAMAAFRFLCATAYLILRLFQV